MLKRLFNVFSFYVGWFLTVELAARGRPLEAVCSSLFFVLTHLLFLAKSLRELLIILIFMVFGFILDTSFIYAGLVVYASPNHLIPWAAPFWVLGLHALFATTLNYSLSWLKSYPFLSAVLGGLGGFFSYVAGSKMEGVTFLLGIWSPLIIGLVWFFYVPFAFYFVNSVLPKIRGESNAEVYEEK